MNAAEIVELVFKIIAFALASASVIGIVWYGVEAIVAGIGMKKKRR